jgi:hypothetical protein
MQANVMLKTFRPAIEVEAINAMGRWHRLSYFLPFFSHFFWRKRDV